MNVKKKKRTPLTIAKKLEILQRLESGVKPNAICKEFNVVKQTVSDIKKNRLKITNYAQNLSQNDNGLYRKTIKLPRNNELEEDIYKWCMDQNSEGLLIRPSDIQATASKLAKAKKVQNFTASNGWLWRFLKRNNMIAKSSNRHLNRQNVPSDGEKPYELYGVENENSYTTVGTENYRTNEECEETYLEEVMIKEEIVSGDEEGYNNEENSSFAAYFIKNEPTVLVEHELDTGSDSSSFSVSNNETGAGDVWNYPSTSYAHQNRNYVNGNDIGDTKKQVNTSEPWVEKINKHQKCKLLKYMASHPEVAKGKQSPQYNSDLIEKHWMKLANHLNNLGPSKTVYEWRKVWSVFKSSSYKNVTKLKTPNGRHTNYSELENKDNRLADKIEESAVTNSLLDCNSPKSSDSEFIQQENQNSECIIDNREEWPEQAKRRTEDTHEVYELQKDTNLKVGSIASSLNRIEEQLLKLNQTLQIFARTLPNKTN